MNTLKHFLTVERSLEYMHVNEERCYYFNQKTKKVIEKKFYYFIENADQISEMYKEKERDPGPFMVSLDVMMDHPGVTYIDENFVKWYAEQVINDKF